MPRTGLDWAWHPEGRPGVDVLKMRGVSFAVRYLWAQGLPDHPESKLLTLAEATRLSAAGIDLVGVWETGAGAMADGYPQGLHDAPRARKAAIAAGMPPSRPVYFAADSEVVTTGQAVRYLVACRETTGPNTVGVYGSYYVVRAAHEYWLAHYPGERIWLWQTRAWSKDPSTDKIRWLPAADLRQGSTVQVVDGVDCDWDTAHTEDFGQWRIGQQLSEEDMTPAELLATKLGDSGPTVGIALQSGFRHARDADSKAGQALAISLAILDALKQMQSGVPIDVAAITAQVEADIAADLTNRTTP